MSEDVQEALKKLRKWAMVQSSRRFHFSVPDVDFDIEMHPANLGSLCFQPLGVRASDLFFDDLDPEAPGRLRDLGSCVALSLRAFRAQHGEDARLAQLQSQSAQPRVEGFDVVVESCGAHFVSGLWSALAYSGEKKATIQDPWVPRGVQQQQFMQELPSLIFGEREAGRVFADRLFMAFKDCPPEFLRGACLSLGQEAGLGQCDRHAVALGCSRSMFRPGCDFFLCAQAIASLGELGADLRPMAGCSLFSQASRAKLDELSLSFARRLLAPHFDQDFARIAAIAQASEISASAASGRSSSSGPKSL